MKNALVNYKMQKSIKIIIQSIGMDRKIRIEGGHDRGLQKRLKKIDTDIRKIRKDQLEQIQANQSYSESF